MNKVNENSGSESKSDELLKSLFRAATASSRQSIKPRSTTGPVPLSASQQQMWFLNQLSPDSPAYNVYRAFYLTGPLHQTVLKNCLKEIVRRHDALRTVFQLNDGVPYQIVQPDMDFDFSYKDLTGIVNFSCLSEDDVRSYSHVSNNPELQELLVSEARKVFDLLNGPCLRAHVFKLGEGEYCFMLAMHHIVCDGWSLSIIIRELADLYEAFTQGHVAPLPELPIQYSDYAMWQQAWLKSESLQPHFGYWQEQLKGYPRSLDLPIDFARQSVQSFHGSCEAVTIPKGLTKRLKAFSSQEGATMFMTLLAAYQVLLSRYSGQTDIVTGSPIANRNHPETQDMIGCFVNTLALRTDLSGSPGFRELVGRVKKMTLDAYVHRELPFQILVEKVQSHRDMTFSPLFQVAFVLQNTPDLAWEFSGLTFKPIHIDNMTAKYDLTLTLREYGGVLKGKLEYSTGLFNRETIRRMLGHFKTLLESITNDPDSSISVLPILTKAEKDQLLLEWNDTKADYPEDKCIHQLFEAQAEKTPDAVAVVYEGQQLTYRGLNEKSNQLANYLREKGVGPEVLVGICMERSIEMIVGVLGVLKAGGAYVPLDSSYPKERQEFILRDSHASVVITKEKRWSHLLLQNVDLVCVDLQCEDISYESVKNLVPLIRPDNLAYIIYTSGSTGKPKGVSIEHRSVVSFLSWVHTVFNKKELSGVLFSTSICLDLSIFELFAPLTSGGKAILVENAMSLPALQAASEVTLINTVPSAITELIRQNGIPSSVCTINLAGEPLFVSLVKKIYENTSVKKVYDLYGPSEDTTYSTWTLRKSEGLYTIGRPIGNTQVYLLDSYKEPVPVGIPGEIYLGGNGLARNYLNRPELTAEKFVSNPFSEEPDARLYKTGDLARYLPDGNIEFLGRIDHQVKIRGYRIELGEIEANLTKHTGVNQVVVTAREDEPGNKRLVAYIVSEKGSKASTSELQEFLKKKLPEYMIPSVFILLESLPLTPNGKLDRKALPPPDHERPELEREFVAPLTHIEKKLVEIWRQVLNLKEVGIEDDFFELGGHSLSAMQLIAWILRDLQVELSVREVFDFSTIHSLANIIVQKSEKSF